MYLKKTSLSIFTFLTFVLFTSFTENNELVTKVLFDDKVEIKIPKNWKLKEVSETITNPYKSYIAFESADDKLSIDLKQHYEKKGNPSDLIFNTKNEARNRTKELVDFKEFFSGSTIVNGRTIHYYEGEIDGRTYILDLYTFFDGKLFQATFFALSYKYNPETIKNLVLKIMLSLKIKTKDISYGCAKNITDIEKELREKVLNNLKEKSFDITYAVSNGDKTSRYRQTFYETDLTFDYMGYTARIVYDKSNNVPAFYYDYNIKGLRREIKQFDNFGAMTYKIYKSTRSECKYDLKQTEESEQYSNLYVRDSKTDQIIREKVSMEFYYLNHL